MESDQQYFRPRVDERTYERVLQKATFLTDNLYVKLTDGYTYETLVQDLLTREQQNTPLSNGS